MGDAKDTLEREATQATLEKEETIEKVCKTCRDVTVHIFDGLLADIKYMENLTFYLGKFDLLKREFGDIAQVTCTECNETSQMPASHISYYS